MSVDLGSPPNTPKMVVLSATEWAEIYSAVTNFADMVKEDATNPRQGREIHKRLNDLLRKMFTQDGMKMPVIKR